MFTTPHVDGAQNVSLVLGLRTSATRAAIGLGCQDVKYVDTLAVPGLRPATKLQIRRLSGVFCGCVWHDAW